MNDGCLICLVVKYPLDPQCFRSFLLSVFLLSCTFLLQSTTIRADILFSEAWGLAMKKCSVHTPGNLAPARLPLTVYWSSWQHCLPASGGWGHFQVSVGHSRTLVMAGEFQINKISNKQNIKFTKY